MIKRITAVIIVVIFILSLSSVVFASEPVNGQSAQLIRNEDGKLVQVYLPAAAKNNANENSQAANNPIDVAGKKWF